MNKHHHDHTSQSNPLLPGYPFNLALVAAHTMAEQGGDYDVVTERAQGLKGYLICLTTSGGGEVRDGDTLFETVPGELLLFPPGVAQYHRRADEQERWHYHWVYFRPRGFWAPWLGWSARASGVGRVRLGDAARVREFEQMFRDIEHVHRSARSTAEELAMNMLERLLICAYEETPAYHGRHLDSRVQAACQFIAKRLEQDTSLQQIAEHVCLSPSRLAHVFREQTGVSIVRWREDQRILLAQHMLQAPGRPISSIAAKVGYDDHLYFSRVFRKRVGVSPSEYRSARELARAA
jgi:AraC family transcriptional regulator of arabinose operon